MKLGMYAVYDSKLGTYDRPFFSMTDAAAVRAFVDEVQEPKQNFVWKRHPEDYSLSKVGLFDDVSGAVDQVKLVNLLTASSALLTRELDS